MVSYQAAAILVLLAGISFWIIWHKPGTRITANSSAAFKVVRLPDYSLVTLGANSTVKYPAAWDKQKVRELWLDGQARFEVKHLHSGNAAVQDFERFIVHLHKHIDVEVLGTVFTVFQRDNVTEMGLEQGKIKVMLNGTDARTVYLEPGKTLRIHGDSTEVFSNTTLPAGTGIAATGNTLQLNNTPVADIIQVIEKTYHTKVSVDDSSLLLRRVDGILPLQNENEVLFILSGILNVTIDNGNPGEIKIRTKN